MIGRSSSPADRARNHHRAITTAFSCKRRGLCPSCTARRMADTAAHLVDQVLPQAPYRQWVFTVPRALRLRLARDPAWATWVGNLAVRAIGGMAAANCPPARGLAQRSRTSGWRGPPTARSRTGSSDHGPMAAPSWCYRRWRSSAGCAGSSRRPVATWFATRECSARPASDGRSFARWYPRGGEPLSIAATPSGARRAGRVPWAELLRRVFATDVLSCPCGGRRSVVAVVVDSTMTRTVLATLGLPCTAATFALARDPPQGELWFDDAR
jgi:hypothetical protein